MRRAGDRHECWPVDTTEALRDVALEANQAGLSIDVAAALVIEHGIVVDELVALVGTRAWAAADELDRRAAAARRRAVLDGAQADYLRSLIACGPSSARSRSTAVPTTLALPVRLLDRIDESVVQRALGHADLIAAKRWEIAAAAAGQTMTEWAAWQTAAVMVEFVEPAAG